MSNCERKALYVNFIIFVLKAAFAMEVRVYKGGWVLGCGGGALFLPSLPLYECFERLWRMMRQRCSQSGASRSCGVHARKRR